MALYTGASNSRPARFGFREGARGTHTSRTMMLSELSVLLSHLPAGSTASEYRAAIVADNVLAKKTDATRRLTAQRLRELYALDPNVTVFRILRQLWEAETEGRPLLACLCANARDPLLRLTGVVALACARGQTVTTKTIADAVTAGASGRLNPRVAHKVARNAASSWTQSGHLIGRNTKIRTQARPTAASTAYALLLGYLTGVQGEMLLTTYWAQLLDTTVDHVDALAFQASRQGWIEYRHSGGVVEASFSALLTADELEAVRGSH